MLDLQRTVGNAATTALIQRTTPLRGPAAAPVLARPIVVARDADFGLRSKAEISGYAGPAADFWKANPTLTLQDFGLHLVDEVNKELVGERGSTAADPGPSLQAGGTPAGSRRAPGPCNSTWPAPPRDR